MTLMLGMWKLREYVCEILHAPLSSVVVMLRAIYLKDKEVHIQGESYVSERFCEAV